MAAGIGQHIPLSSAEMAKLKDARPVAKAPADAPMRGLAEEMIELARRVPRQILDGVAREAGVGEG